jgi:hypothetical protein
MHFDEPLGLLIYTLQPVRNCFRILDINTCISVKRRRGRIHISYVDYVERRVGSENLRAGGQHGQKRSAALAGSQRRVGTLLLIRNRNRSAPCSLLRLRLLVLLPSTAATGTVP